MTDGAALDKVIDVSSPGGPVRTELMTLAVFVGDLCDRLEAFSAEQLRDIVLAYGRSLPGRDRAAFLELFPTTAVAALQAPDLRQWVNRTWCDVRFLFGLGSAKRV